MLTWAYHLSHLLAELPLRADVWPSCCPTIAERIALFNSGNQQRSESIIRQIKVVVPHKMSRRNKLTPHYSWVPGKALKEQCTLALRGFNHCHYKIIACLMLIGLPCSRQVEMQGIESGRLDSTHAHRIGFICIQPVLFLCVQQPSHQRLKCGLQIGSLTNCFFSLRCVIVSCISWVWGIYSFFFLQFSKCFCQWIVYHFSCLF